MDVIQLYQLIENPSLLDKETLPALRQWVGEYPYFQVAKILYLKNLAILEESSYTSELRKMAIHISDRKKLFSFIESEKWQTNGTTAKEETTTQADSFDLIDSFLTSQKEEDENGTDSSPVLLSKSLSADYLHWSIHEEVSDTEEEPAHRLQHQELIDSFIKEDKQRIPGSGIKPADEHEYAEDYPFEETDPNEDSASLITNDDDSYFTETLARIYIKQKRYDKALQIIKGLSLKYPEKNIYFADQIRFLKKLITNNIKQD